MFCFALQQVVCYENDSKRGELVGYTHSLSLSPSLSLSLSKVCPSLPVTTYHTSWNLPRMQSYTSLSPCLIMKGAVQSQYEEAFIQEGRLSHLSQLLGSHPTYLTRFNKLHHFLMRGNGPLPLHIRNYLAILVGLSTLFMVSVSTCCMVCLYILCTGC